MNKIEEKNCSISAISAIPKPEPFRIEVSYDPSFTELIEGIREKYGDELLSLSGIGKKDLDRSTFANRFFKTEVTADSSIDPNSNLSDHSTISYSFESGKSFNKLNSLYLIWKEIGKERGKQQANAIIEQVLRGDLYIHDLHGVESGKPYCVAGDTRVLTTKGAIRIKELISRMEKGEEFEAVLSQDHTEKITQHHVKKDQVLFEIQTGAGYRVKATADHKFLVWSRTEERKNERRKYDMVFKPLSQIVKGDHLLIPRLDMDGDYKEFHGVKFDERVARILAISYTYGMYDVHSGDYWVEFPESIGKKDQDRLLADVKSLLADLGGDPDTDIYETPNLVRPGYSFNGIRIGIRNENFANFMLSAGFAGHKRHTAKCSIPEILFDSPKSVVCAFLYTLIALSAQSTRPAKAIRRKNKPFSAHIELFHNNTLAHDVQVLALHAGIPIRLYATDTSASLELPSWTYKAFFDLVGVPEYSDYTKECFDKTMNWKCRHGYSVLNFEYEGVKYFRVPVRKITQLAGLHDVYDIGTGDSHMFCANGILVHNCFNYSTYDVMAEGLPMVNKVKCLPPKHLFAFKSQLEQFTVIASNSTLGGFMTAPVYCFSAYQQGSEMCSCC